MNNIADCDNSFRLETWGKFACFSRPELKTERVSYDVITPSAARGLMEAIYWHPGIEYRIDRIYVRSPIRTMNLRRNEVKSKISARNLHQGAKRGSLDGLWLATSQDIVQRAALLLRDVRYVIDGHVELDPGRMAPGDNPMKFRDIIQRRLRKGQCYFQPYLGCREFPAHFRVPDETGPCPEELLGERDLGFVLWDIDYSDPGDIHPLFFRAKMIDGVIDVPARDSQEVMG